MQVNRLRNKAEGDAKKDMKSDDDKFGDNKRKAQGKTGMKPGDKVEGRTRFKDMKCPEVKTNKRFRCCKGANLVRRRFCKI